MDSDGCTKIDVSDAPPSSPPLFPSAWRKATAPFLLVLLLVGALTIPLTLWASPLNLRCDFVLRPIAEEVGLGSPGFLGQPGLEAEASPTAEQRSRSAGKGPWEWDGVTVYGDACGYGGQEVADILGRLNITSSDSAAWYFVKETWVDIGSVGPIVEQIELEHGQTVCVLTHLQGFAPCLEKACVLPVHVRPHFTDVAVLSQIVQSNVFAFLEGYNFTTILDAGSNIGLAAVIFALMFPEARIVAVELSPDNFEVLEKNIAYLDNVLPINAGLYDSITTLTFGSLSVGEGWGYFLHKENKAAAQNAGQADGVPALPADEIRDYHPQNIPITTVTVQLLLQMFHLKRFDFIKMDIEGAEREIFRGGGSPGSTSPHSWLEECSLFVVETHFGEDGGYKQTVLDGMQQHPKFNVTMEGEYFTYFDPNKAPQRIPVDGSQ